MKKYELIKKKMKKKINRSIKKIILIYVNTCRFFVLFFSRRERVYWWSMVKHNKGDLENFGDFLTKYIVTKISGVSPVFIDPKEFLSKFFNHYLMVGSIIRLGNNKSIIWGSGIMSINEEINVGKVLAVRGPRTSKRLTELGYPKILTYGDPAILLPLLYVPKLENIYEFGIVSHYVDYDEIKKILIKNNVNITLRHINLLTNSVEKTIEEIHMCKKIISTSLHGIIVANAYQIPTLWWKFSNNLGGDDIKFLDYFESVNLYNIKPIITSEIQDLINSEEYFIPKKEVLKSIQMGLLKTYPFKMVDEISKK